MTLTSSILLTSPKFLCKYVQSTPPSAVVCYVHSQLAVQPCKVQNPFIFQLNGKKNTVCGRKSFGKESSYSQVQGLLSFQSKGRVSQYKSKHQPLRLLQKYNGNVKMDKNAKDMSLISRWNHDPLMDHKQLVVMVFKEDAFTGRPSIGLSKDLLNSASSQEYKKPSKGPVAKQKVRDTSSTSFGKYSRAPQQDRRPRSLKGSVDRVLKISSSNSGINNSISEAALLFLDFCSDEKDVKKPEIKKTFQSGPNNTQLSSVLLELREEIPLFFLKKPNYATYHKRIKFVNNITGVTTHGIYPYKSQVSGLRFLMLSCMTELSVEVLKITKHPNEAAIKVRWRIKGIPLIRKLVPYLGRKVRVDSYGYRYLDGFSVFEVGSDGLIHCHRLHKVMPSSSQEKENPLWMIVFLPLIHLLNPRQCESFSAFECCSTDKEIESLTSDSAVLAC